MNKRLQRKHLWISPEIHYQKHFQIPIRPGRQVFTHEPKTLEIRRLIPHYDVKFDLPFTKYALNNVTQRRRLLSRYRLCLNYVYGIEHANEQFKCAYNKCCTQMKCSGFKEKRACRFTLEPRYNEVPRDWQNVFVMIRRIRLIRVLSHTFYYYSSEEYHSLYWGLRYIGVGLLRFHCNFFYMSRSV